MSIRIPIKWKIALWVSLMSGGALMIFAGLTLMSLRRNELQEEDQELAAAARELVTNYRNSKISGHPFHGVAMEAWAGYAFFDDKGKLVDENGLIPQHAAALLRQKKGFQEMAVGAHNWRFLVLEEKDLVLVAGYDLSNLEDTIEDLLAAYGLALPLAMVMVAAGAFFLASRALRPIREIIDKAESIKADHLDLRFPVPPANDEVRKLSFVLNQLFDRLEKSFKQARRFASDASHEMRTPLTIMRCDVERLLQRTDLNDELEKRLLNLQEEIAYLDRLTESLLLLARFDSGQRPSLSTPFNLSELLRELCEDASLLADAKGVRLEQNLAPDIHICGDPVLIRRMLLNLVDNATRYNRTSGRMAVELSTDGVNTSIVIANEGKGIPVEQRELVFQRFYVMSGSREKNQSGSGHGLGLSLCREIAQAHGGTLSIGENSTEVWTELVAKFPTHRGPCV